MKLKFCKTCKKYTLKENCCQATSQAGYKYIRRTNNSNTDNN